ncbi:hypothetical protein CR513_01376, partial [Mucuna pruriens]
MARISSFGSEKPMDTELPATKEKVIFIEKNCTLFLSSTMSAIETKEQVTLKLMVIKVRNKVLFAEASKDFVDVLFSFLTLPLGTIARLVGKESNMQPCKVGSLWSLYQGVVNFEKEFMFNNTCKEMLLRPKNSMENYCNSLKLNIDDTGSTRYFVCNRLCCCQFKSSVLLSTFKNQRCSCGDLFSKPISLERSDTFVGFVKNSVSFLITDDLKVVPNSVGNLYCLLKNYGIEDMSLASEVTVSITENQVLDLLKSCLHSKTTLTDCFLEKQIFETSFRNIEFPSCDFDANGTSKINVRIMHRKSNGKILFAEGKEDFADFIFSFLTIPLGGAVHLMKGCCCSGNIDGLYKSVVDLDDDFWATKEVKNKVINPSLAPQFKLSNMLLPINYDVPKYFCCVEYIDDGRIKRKNYRYNFDAESVRTRYLTDRAVNVFMGSCFAAEFVNRISDKWNEGYARGPTMNIVTDDLVVSPMSSISVMSLLHSMSIPFSDLEEKVVSIGMEEGVRILQASLTSTSALTTGLSHLLTEVKEKVRVNKSFRR